MIWHHHSLIPQTPCTLSDCINILCLMATFPELSLTFMAWSTVPSEGSWNSSLDHISPTLYHLRCGMTCGGVLEIILSPFGTLLTHMYMCCHSCLLHLLSCLHIIVIMLTSLPRTLTNGHYTSNEWGYDSFFSHGVKDRTNGPWQPLRLVEGPKMIIWILKVHPDKVTSGGMVEVKE